MKTQKGITLIVLTITIIIMLILLGVGTKIAINGGFFNTAQKAVGDTNNKVALHESIASELTGELDGVIQGQCDHTYGDWTIVKEAACKEVGEKERTCTKCGKKEKGIIQNTKIHIAEK